MFLGTFIFCMVDIAMNLYMQHFEMKKCKYDCYKCKNWRCPKHYCDKKRKELINKE